METDINVELLYFDDCPSWKKALELLTALMAEKGYSKDVALIRVETQEEAEAHKFIGSPTIRINRVDLFPVEQESYALGCRVYQTPEGFKGWPSEEMLRDRLNLVSID